MGAHRPILRNTARGFSGYAFKPYHTASAKLPIDLVSELNLKKGSTMLRDEKDMCRFKRDIRNGHGGIPNPTIQFGCVLDVVNHLLAPGGPLEFPA